MLVCSIDLARAQVEGGAAAMASKNPRNQKWCEVPAWLIGMGRNRQIGRLWVVDHKLNCVGETSSIDRAFEVYAR